MQYGENELSNTLVLAQIGLILFYVVERVIYTPSLQHYGKFEDKIVRVPL